LTAPCEERVWTILGAEFGGDASEKTIIVQALYCLKVQEHFCSTLGRLHVITWLFS
jgi:hypothetical protein